MDKTLQNLTPRQAKVIAALLETATVSQAVRRAGVSRVTYYAWVRESTAFREAILHQTGEMYEFHLARMRSLMSQAGEELGRLMKHKDARIRLGACKQVLESSARAHELLDLGERLTKLEAGVAPNGRLSP